ncbi:MAG: hypothetical protein IPP84_05275 [Propionivibrio sp.]|nr:hypothetical protein [Propionivibrio sp.]
MKRHRRVLFTLFARNPILPNSISDRRNTPHAEPIQTSVHTASSGALISTAALVAGGAFVTVNGAAVSQNLANALMAEQKAQGA